MTDGHQQNDETKFIAKLIRFRPELWERIQRFQRRDFIKRDQDAIFELLDRALTSEGFPPSDDAGEKE